MNPELGDRLADLAARSSETRSVLDPFHLMPQSPLTDLTNLPPHLSAPNDDPDPRPQTDTHPMPRASNTPTPAPPNDSPGASQPSSDVTGRPLNVTDALSYLDAVKMQFQDKPEVYNQFLDIMKDFKSQVIDTPGVIQRVSMLFNGNPYLIQGFNTFLPLGYRIDISVDPLDPNAITVTTPLGTTIQNTNSTSPIPRTGLGIPPPAVANPMLFLASTPTPHTILGGMTPRSLTPQVFQLAHGQPQFDPTFSPGFQNPTAAAASVLGNLNNKNPTVEKQPPGEFNHAIQYLNKIKARYSDDPNTYKQFLDILQTYQKEQKHLQDSQVYVQVQTLFKNDQDLLAEFKDFLPEAVGGGGGPSVPSVVPQVPAAGPASWPQPEASSSSPVAVPAKKSTQASKRKKRVVEKEPTPAPPTKVVPSRQTKKTKLQHNPDTGSPAFSPYVAPHSPPQYPHATSALQSHHIQSQPSLHLPGHSGNASADKLLFFDRAKKSLENREVYEEFLKLLGLFSKDIFDVNTLIERTRVFLGDGELMSEFKDLVGWDDRQESVENGPPGSIRTGPPVALAALPADDGEGPSYRRLLDSEVRLACSGRDELCRSVLNDVWVSHPTWASEEAQFVAHKKNSFEEALHKSEEERHEYHVQIEALTRTIAVLEPLSARIEDMTNEERSLFKLKSDFGGAGKSIYHRMIKRVYGKDSGLEIIQALQDCPSVAVPVVLARLKQKDEEWRRAQREWSRTWREVDSKNFYKSLDHQGISFKQNDKKNITAKYFVGDIEAIKSEQLSKEKFDFGSVEHQLEYTFYETSVLLDSLKMVYSFLDRSQAQYSAPERRSVEKFLRAFIPRLCNYPEAEFNAACGPLEGPHEDEAMHDINGHADGQRSGRRSIGSPHSAQSGGVPANDLRKKLLRTAQEKAAGRDAHASSGDSRPMSPSLEHLHASHSYDDSRAIPDIWIKDAGMRSELSPSSDVDHPLFVNTTFYTLLRLLQLLYSRLLMCKEIGSQLALQQHAPLLANVVAVDLGLDDPNGPSAVLAQTIEVLGRDSSEGANVVYMYLLSACEKLFDNELDQATFEEHMRWFFGTKAYHLFTLDKLITALIKQVQTIISDNKCQELWTLLQAAQNSDRLSQQDIIRYRREAERHVGQDDHLYRLQWVRESKCIHVSLVGADDPSIPTDGLAISRWQGYLNTFVMTYPTEWLPAAHTKEKRSPVMLKRCVRANSDSIASTTKIEGYMKIRVRLPTYKMVYESGSEDFLWRKRGAEEWRVLEERDRARKEERGKCCWLQCA